MIAMEGMIFDQYGSQWSLKIPLAGANGISKLCFQFLGNSYLCPSNIYMSLKAMLLYTCSKYNKRYYRLCYKIPSSSEEDPEDHPFDPEDPRALYTPPQRK